MLLLLLACTTRVAAPAAPPVDPSGDWELTLQRVVDAEGRVDYRRLRKNPAALKRFVGWIAAHGPEMDGYPSGADDLRLAWHLNAYNAAVLWGVLQAGEITSVRDVPGLWGLPGSGFFWKQRFLIDGEWRSLHGYEQDLILATYEEPLAHAALNCASRDCPPLRNELYRKSKIRTQLDDQMRRWVATGGAVRRAEDGVFEFNAIFDWYADDFRREAGAATPCDAVRPYAGPELDAALSAAPDCPHRFRDYDWRLNDTSVPGFDN